MTKKKTIPFGYVFASKWETLKPSKKVEIAQLLETTSAEIDRITLKILSA